MAIDPTTLPAILLPRAKPKKAGKKAFGKIPKPINWDFVSKAMQAGSTQVEISAWIGMSPANFYKRMKSDLGMKPSEAVENQSSIGKMQIRMTQHATAIRGSVPMQIWLGKNRLGQSDKIDQTTTGTTFLVVTTAKLKPEEWESAWGARQGAPKADAE